MQRLEKILPTYNAGSKTYIDLKDEKTLTRQCIRICTEAGSYVQKYTDQHQIIPEPNNNTQLHIDESSGRTVYTIGEATAEGNSDQVVANTTADQFDVGKVSSRDKSAQLITCTTDETLLQISQDRYRSFPALTSGELATNNLQMNSHTPNRNTQHREGRSREKEARTKRANQNEARKRIGDEDSVGT